MVSAATLEIYSFAYKSAPFSVQIDNIWDIGITDDALTLKLVTQSV